MYGSCKINTTMPALTQQQQPPSLQSTIPSDQSEAYNISEAGDKAILSAQFQQQNEQSRQCQQQQHIRHQQQIKQEHQSGIEHAQKDRGSIQQNKDNHQKPRQYNHIQRQQRQLFQSLQQKPQQLQHKFIGTLPLKKHFEERTSQEILQDNLKQHQRQHQQLYQQEKETIQQQDIVTNGSGNKIDTQCPIFTTRNNSATAENDSNPPRSLPCSRKQRPKFISLPVQNYPDIPPSGQFGNRAFHSKFIQKTVEQHQNNSIVTAPPKTDTLILDPLNHTSHLNGYVLGSDNSQESIVENDPNLPSNLVSSKSDNNNQSKDAASYLTKIASRFVSPDTVNSPCDSLCSVDSTPWNMEGTETIVENPSKKSKSTGLRSNFDNKVSPFIERELETLREENQLLKAALEEAGRLNGQWRAYHQERQGYVERLLSTIHSLQLHQASSSPTSAQFKNTEAGGSDGDVVHRWKDALSKAQAEYQEHITLLQMQVRAHRDDWEAESAEKRLERTGRQEAEAKAALLLLNLHHLQQKISDTECKWPSTCNHCGASFQQRVDGPQKPISSDTGTSKQMPQHSSSNSVQQKQQPHAASVISGAMKQSTQSSSKAGHTILPLTADGLKTSNPHSTQSSIGREKHSISTIETSDNAMNEHCKSQNANEKNKTMMTRVNQSKSPQPNGYTKQSTNTDQSNAGEIPNGYHKDPKHSRSSGYSGYNKNTQPTDINNRMRSDDVEEQFLRNSSFNDCTEMSAVSTKTMSEYGVHERHLNGLQRHSSQGLAANNIPLKGWIPVSMMHQIAFGGPDDQRRLHHSANSYNAQSSNYSNSPNSFVYGNYDSPCTSRESSIFSCTSSENTSEVQNSASIDHNYSTFDSVNFERTGAKPKVSRSRPNHLEDDQKKAKHRARNILANALPVSPVSSGPSTPAGNVLRPYGSMTVPHQVTYPTTTQACQNAQVETGSEMRREETHLQKSKNQDGLSMKPVTIDKSDNKDNTERISSISNPTVANNKTPEITEVSNKSLHKTHQAETDLGQKLSSSNKPDRKKHNNIANNSNQISSSTSNDTSRSSSPGMSLTTFALTSEGRGVPGAICFSLHPDVKQCINTGILTSVEPTSPKKELAVSHVHIEPKSPKPIKSPIEISTKEHWWCVDEKDHFSYPEKSEYNQINGTLVNSTFVKLHDSGKKENHSEQRTARALSSQELAHQRKQSQEETVKLSNSVKNSSNTNTTTFCFTPAVNSSASSSTLSSLESSKSCSPPRQQTTHLKSMASKNIASAIISYEIAAKGDRIVYADRLKPSEVVAKSKPRTTKCPDGVATITSKEIICPSCQMLFSKERHLHFLDHFETCKGPEFADL